MVILCNCKTARSIYWILPPTLPFLSSVHYSLGIHETFPLSLSVRLYGYSQIGSVTGENFLYAFLDWFSYSWYFRGSWNFILVYAAVGKGENLSYAIDKILLLNAITVFNCTQYNTIQLMTFMIAVKVTFLINRCSTYHVASCH